MEKYFKNSSDYALQVNEGQKWILNRNGLDVDSVKVVSVHLKHMTDPKTNKRKHGNLVDENFTEKILLNYDDMVEAIIRKEEYLKKKS